jgi:uncharacterized protein YutE (UPF0331/DUF86 family)/predicted nucleotidyltransferase
MLEALRRVLADDPRVAYAIAFGSAARGAAGSHSDVDAALGLLAGARLTARELGALAARLEAAAGRPVDLVLLDEAPPGLAYRVFRDGRPILTRDASALAERKARAILEYFDFQPIEELCARGALDALPPVVDRAILAARIAAVRDAVARIREVLPPALDAFRADRTLREVVILNLFVALQECLSLSAHWLADAGLDVPQSYAQVFLRLGERGVVGPELAERMAAASGLRNLVAHRYGALEWNRIHEIASTGLDDLLAFCEALARRAAD